MIMGQIYQSKISLVKKPDGNNIRIKIERVEKEETQLICEELFNKEALSLILKIIKL